MNSKQKILKSILLIVVACLVVGILWFGGQKVFGNHAQRELKTVFNLSSLNSKLICDNGDNGLSLDNNLPWYEAYYYVANTPDLQAQITTMATQHGYQLSDDKQTAASLNGLNGFDYQTFLTADNSGKQLKVAIASKNETIDLDQCPNSNSVATATTARAIIEFSVQLPRR